MFSFADRPGVLGTIAAAVAQAGINIDDVRNPHDDAGQNSIAVLKINRPAPAELVADIATKIDASLAACLTVS